MINTVILGDGLLGSELKKVTNWDLLSRKNSKFDIFNSQNFDLFLHQYDTVINCIANTNTYSEETSHYQVNYKFVVDLVDYANQYNKKIVHISTGYIYQNNDNNPSELDFPMYQSTKYAYYKNLADEYIKLKSNNYVIIRSVHKPNPFPYEFAFEDHFGNFSYVDEVCEFIVDCVNLRLAGLFNIGKDFMSMHDFAKLTKKDIKPRKKPKHMPDKVSYNCNKYKKHIHEKNRFSY